MTDESTRPRLTYKDLLLREKALLEFEHKLITEREAYASGSREQRQAGRADITWSAADRANNTNLAQSLRDQVAERPTPHDKSSVRIADHDHSQEPE